MQTGFFPLALRNLLISSNIDSLSSPKSWASTLPANNSKFKDIAAIENRGITVILGV